MHRGIQRKRGAFAGAFAGERIDDVNLEEFVAERNAALLSLDRSKIEAFVKKYGIDWTSPSCDEVFWCAVHKARTAIKKLPQEARELSEQWLAERNFESWADK